MNKYLAKFIAVILLLCLGYWISYLSTHMWSSNTDSESSVDIREDITSFLGIDNTDLKLNLDDINFTPGQYESDDARPTDPSPFNINKAIQYNDIIIDLVDKDISDYSEYFDALPDLDIDQANAMVDQLSANIDILISKVMELWCFYDNCDFRDSTVDHLNKTKSMYDNEERDWINSYFYDSDEDYDIKSDELDALIWAIDDEFSQKQEAFSQNFGYAIED